MVLARLHKATITRRVVRLALDFNYTGAHARITERVKRLRTYTMCFFVYRYFLNNIF